MTGLDPAVAAPHPGPPDHGDAHARGHSHAGSHGHAHGGAPGRGSERRIVVVIALNAVLAVVQLVGGMVFSSMALLADTAHQAVDVVGLVVTLIALRLLREGPSARRTFGWGRADAVGAGVSGLILLATTGWVVVEAVLRLVEPEHVHGGGVLVLGAVGMVINGLSVWLLTGGVRLSERAARLHLLTDVAGSAAVLVAGAIVLTTGWDRVDPGASLVISVVVISATVGLLRRAGQVLTDATPAGIDADDVLATMRAVPGVSDVHHLHVWLIAPEEVAVSAHVLVAGDRSVHEAQVLTGEVERALQERFGVAELTVQVECHPCGDEAHTPVPR